MIAYTPIRRLSDRRWHKPIPGRRVEIVDEDDRPVKTGEIGRLRVATDTGPQSYLYQPEASRAFFRDGFFYTGDLAAFRDDGRFALQGRLTDVINVKGVKMSPAPMEDRLRAALGIEGVCIVSILSEQGEEQVHVVIESATPLPADRVEEVVRQDLSGAPLSVTSLGSLPRTPTGKIVRSEVRKHVMAVQR